MVGASKGVKKEMHTGYWSGNLKEKNGLEDWAQLERISIDFKAKKSGKAWTGAICSGQKK
jgi:hypothetical protein